MSLLELKEIKIEVTQKCPLNCLHCSSEANISKSVELTSEQVIQIVKDAKKLGVREITLSGGEPLLWPPLCEVISFCEEVNVPVVVYTTGNPLFDSTSLLGSLTKAGLKSVVVSLYGASPEIHDSITRVHESFDRTLFAIKNMISEGIRVGIHFVAMSPNWKEFSDVAELSRNLGVSRISVLRFVPHGRGSLVKDIFSLSKENLIELKKDISQIKKNKNSITIRIGSPFNILLFNDDVYCMASIDRAIIGPDGKAFPCDAFKNLDYPGNLCSLSQGSLIDIWHNSDYFNFVRNQLNQGLGPICNECHHKTKCKGGCLAQKVLRIPKGNSLHPDPDCILRR